MKVAIIGATGKAGNMILKEVLTRPNMEVTAIVRNKAKLHDDVAVIEKDLFDLTIEDVVDFDIIVDAFNAPHGKEEMHQGSLKHLTTILGGDKATRLMVVGGAGSLYVDPEKKIRLMDTEGFPEAFMPTASHMGKALDDLKKVTDVQWTYVSPSAMFLPDGERTGKYQIGEDHLLTNAAGESEISYADYAIAFVDEMENGKFINKRFTVASI